MMREQAVKELRLLREKIEQRSARYVSSHPPEIDDQLHDRKVWLRWQRQIGALRWAEAELGEA